MEPAAMQPAPTQPAPVVPGEMTPQVPTPTAPSPQPNPGEMMPEVPVTPPAEVPAPTPMTPTTPPTEPPAQMPAPAALPDGVVFQDNFESYTAGAPPSAPWIGHFNGNPAELVTYVSISTERANSGAQALNVDTQMPAAFAYMAVPEAAATAPKVYIRLFIHASNGVGVTPNGHSDLIKLGSYFTGNDGQPISGQGDSSAIKYGEANGAIGMNLLQYGDAIFPRQEMNDDPIPAGAWHCVEILFDRSIANHAIVTSLDGAVISTMASDSERWQNGPAPADWLAPAFEAQMGLGWQPFSAMGNDIFFDDLVISTKPVGCEYRQ